MNQPMPTLDAAPSNEANLEQGLAFLSELLRARIADHSGAEAALPKLAVPGPLTWPQSPVPGAAPFAAKAVVRPHRT